MNRDIIVIGASAGGVEAVPRLLSSFRAGTPAAFFVTMHIVPHAESYLPTLIARQGNLPAEHPRPGTPIRPGRVYVAPPDHHLLLRDGHIHLGHGPKENRHRPAIDPMFRSAAQAYGERVVGVVLTGNLDDGVAGLSDIQQHRGLAVVQDPEEAQFPDMPRNALLSLKPDHVLRLKAIEALLKSLPGACKPRGGRMKSQRNARMRTQSPDMIAELPKGAPVPYVCPECHGPMWEKGNGELVRFQCMVGHRYSLSSLLEAHGEELEAALWIALRTLEERINLQRRLAEQSRTSGHVQARKVFQAKVNENVKHAKVLRKVLERLAT